MKQQVVKNTSVSLCGRWLMMWHTPLCLQWCHWRPQSSSVFRCDSLKWSSGKWLIVCCKHCDCCWVYTGLPQCAHRFFWPYAETVCDLKGLDLCFYVPPPFMSIFYLTCLSKSTRESRGPLCCLSELLVKVKIPKTTHALFSLQSKQMSTLMKTPAFGKRTRNRTKKTIRQPPNGRAFLSISCTPLRPAFLVAHLRKTSVPPHDV